MPESPIRKLVPFADEAKAKGIKVYHLNIGDPDIETPEVMLNALHNFEPKIIRYGNSKGEKDFLEAMVTYYQRLGFKDIQAKNLQITIAGSEAIFWAMMAIANPGDEIIVFEPFYANYNGFAKMAGVKLVPILTRIEDGFHLPSKDEIKKKITPKTRGILICNPNNPTGTLYSKQELVMLAGLCRENNLYLLSDEVYREFTYDGKKQTSVLELDYPEGIIILDSLSKRYSLCGARLGCIVSRNTELITQVLKLGQARLSAGLIDQMMASKLTEVPESYTESVKGEYQKRRDTVIEGLGEIPGAVYRKPEGAFYIIAKLPVDEAEKFAKWMLTDFSDNNETVMVAPAAGFYGTSGLGIQEIRIAYVINQNDLARSMELLKKGIDTYNKNHEL